MAKVRIESMSSSTSGRARERKRAWDISDHEAWKSMASQDKVSQRFITRAGTDTLPHYANIARKCIEEEDYISAYMAVYGQEGATGECRCCDNEEQETMHHMMLGCEAGEVERTKALTEIGNIWKEAKKGDEWKAINWVNPQVNMEDHWEPWWTWVGRVPAWVMCTLTERKGAGATTQKLVNKTARRLAEGYAMWKTRIETSLKWEKEVGITERKGNMNKRGWRAWRIGAEGTRRRGRPRLEGDVRPETLLRRARVDKYRELLAEGKTVAEATSETAEWARWRNKERASARRKGNRELGDRSIWEFMQRGVREKPVFRKSRREGAWRRKRGVADKELLRKKEEWNKLPLNRMTWKQKSGKCLHPGCTEHATEVIMGCKRKRNACPAHARRMCAGYKYM